MALSRALLEKVAKGEITVDEAAKLAAADDKPGNLTLKISEKGCVSIYGLNARFPISAYAEQWVRIFSAKDEILAKCQEALDHFDSKRPEAEVRAEIDRLLAA